MLGSRNSRPPSLPMAGLLLVATLVGCAQPKPYAYLNENRWVRSEKNTFDTFIVSIDGQSPPGYQPITVAPGPHHIVFQTRPSAGFAYSPSREMNIDIKPCTRYWFEAKRENALQQDFEPRVNYEEPIGECPAG